MVFQCDRWVYLYVLGSLGMNGTDMIVVKIVMFSNISVKTQYSR